MVIDTYLKSVLSLTRLKFIQQDKIYKEIYLYYMICKILAVTKCLLDVTHYICHLKTLLWHAVQRYDQEMCIVLPTEHILVENINKIKVAK